ncbi:MAG: hypothetical protein M5U15_03540 [Kiritimatiellae bacterium]|nr:hypothetical protein [Kiritimatiellia bacterium]
MILILLFGIASNTPDLWRMFYVYRPDLFIFEEVMTEYGYLHTDAGGGHVQVTPDQGRLAKRR